MKRETTIAAVALAVAPLLLVAHAATAQAREGALARASFIEAPKDTRRPRAGRRRAAAGEEPESQPAEQPGTQSPEPDKPTESGDAARSAATRRRTDALDASAGHARGSEAGH